MGRRCGGVYPLGDVVKIVRLKLLSEDEGMLPVNMSCPLLLAAKEDCGYSTPRWRIHIRYKRPLLMRETHIIGSKRQ